MEFKIQDPAKSPAQNSSQGILDPAIFENQKPLVQKLLNEVGKVVVGQTEMVEGILMGLMTKGHVLLEGVPGLAKTLTISAVAKSVSLEFHRIQFTPDLLPSDLIGTMIFNPKSGEFSPKKGPIFSNIVLADEINRAPAKVQSALLEAMAEKQVTIGEVSYPLEDPFLVLATQNPLEQEGTYPLPEAQMDRFLFKIEVKYPTKEEELEILNRMSQEELPKVEPVLSREEVLFLGHCATQVFIDEKLKNYIVDLVQATREPKQFGLQKLVGVLQVGASPRASLSLIKASRAHALLKGRGFVTLEDIRAVAFPILRHRLILSFEADAENISTDEVVREIVSQIEVL